MKREDSQYGLSPFHPSPLGVNQTQKRCALYCRVSTNDQSCELQVRELTEYVSKRSGWAIHRIYQDTASGTTPNRKMLQALLSDCRQRRVDVVIVWKLDRLFRSLKSMVVTIQEWGDLGIEFVSVTDSIDLGSPTGRLMMHLISAFAEFEVSLVRSRVKAGLEAARARGARIGRPPLDPALATQVRSLRAEGMSIRQIERALNRTVSRGSIVRILKQAVPKPLNNSFEKTQSNQPPEKDE